MGRPSSKVSFGETALGPLPVQRVKCTLTWDNVSSDVFTATLHGPDRPFLAALFANRKQPLATCSVLGFL